MAKLYCLFDTIGEESGPIFEARNDAMARRIYDQLTDLPPGATKADFKLLKLGSYYHGDQTKMPQLYALSKAYDITHINQKVLDKIAEEEENAVDVAVSDNKSA